MSHERSALFRVNDLYLHGNVKQLQLVEAADGGKIDAKMWLCASMMAVAYIDVREAHQRSAKRIFALFYRHLFFIFKEEIYSWSNVECY